MTLATVFERELAWALLMQQQQEDEAVRRLNSHDAEGRSILHLAAERSPVERVRELLGCPWFDRRVSLNKKDRLGQSPLHAACRENGVEVVLELLAHPELDAAVTLNGADEAGQTPLHCAAEKGDLAMVRALLEDPRLDAGCTLRRHDVCANTPLHTACIYGHLSVMQEILRHSASRTLDAECRVLLILARTYCHIHIVHWILASCEIMTVHIKGSGSLTVQQLLDEYEADPRGTRQMLRMESGLSPQDAASLFALVVFCCDGLLRLSPTQPESKIKRFFGTLLALPMELQMRVCHLAFGLNRQHVLSPDSEPAFEKLANLFPLSE